MWLQRNQAVQVINAYAEAVGGSKGGSGGSSRAAAPSSKRVKGSELLDMMKKRTV